MKPVALAPLPRWYTWVRLLLTVFLAAAGLTTTAIFLPPHHVDYAVQDGMFVVDAELGVLELGRAVPLDDVGEVRTVDPGGAHRTNGTGMHDLCHGEWTLATGQDVWMATTCTAPALMIDVAGEERPWVVSPADPGALQAALASGQDGAFSAEVGPTEPWFWWGVRFVTPVLFLVMVPLLARAGSGLSAAIDGSELVVTTGWRTLRFPLAGATVRRGLERHGMWRIKAIRIGSVHLGRARGALGPVQLLVTDRKRAVEVAPVEGLPVVVSVADVDAFEAACVAAGAAKG